MSAAVKNWIGQQLGQSPYRVVRGLSAGGMALVYLAENLNDGRRVVVKCPRPDAQDPFLEARFGEEIQAMSALRHPHIMPLLTHGVHEGVPFLVLPFLQGGSLLERWRARPPASDPQNLATWLPAISNALDFLHRYGWLHRDVKPANILFDAAGIPFLADLGLTKTYADPGRPGLTRIGSPAPGTPRYMAPEMLTAEHPDGRADQFSLAVMLYEGLSGQSPYPGDSPQAVLRSQAMVQPAPLHHLKGGLPEALSTVLMRGIALRREHRYGTCGQFSQEVLAALNVYAAPTPALANAPTWSIPDAMDLPPIPAQPARVNPAPLTVPPSLPTNPGTPLPHAWHPASAPLYPPLPPQAGPGVVGRFVRAVFWLGLGLFLGGLMLPGSPVHRSVADPFARWMKDEVGWTLPWLEHTEAPKGPPVTDSAPPASDLDALRKALDHEISQKKLLEEQIQLAQTDAGKAQEQARAAEERVLHLEKERDAASKKTAEAESNAAILRGERDAAIKSASGARGRADDLDAQLIKARLETEAARKVIEDRRPFFAIVNDTSNRLFFQLRSQSWDGKWSDWQDMEINGTSNGIYSRPGAVKLEVRFDYIGGDAEATFCDPILIHTQTFPRDASPGFTEIDARYQFEWYDGNKLRLFRQVR